MNTTRTAINTITLVQTLCDHPLIKRARLGYMLEAPFNWTLINAAATAARQLDEVGVTAQELDADHMRQDLLSNEKFNSERYDQLVVRMASLRHFNRSLGANEVGMGTINKCLGIDEADIDYEMLKERAREQVKIERRMGRLKADKVVDRFKDLVEAKVKEAEERKRQMKRLTDQVYFLCNSTGDILFHHKYEQQLDAGVLIADHDLCDHDEFGYLLDGVLEKCVEPLIRARAEIQLQMDRSYRAQTLRDAELLLTEVDKLAKEVGIDFRKIDAQNESVDSAIDGFDKAHAAEDTSIDALDCEIPSATPAQAEQPKPKRVRVAKPQLAVAA